MKSSKKDDPTSDKDHKKVFRAFGYMVPVGKDGRRLWSKGFKEKIGRRLALRRLSVEEVEKKCGLPKSVLNEWKRDAEDAPENKSSDGFPPRPVFAELKMKKTTLRHQRWCQRRLAKPSSNMVSAKLLFRLIFQLIDWLSYYERSERQHDRTIRKQ